MLKLKDIEYLIIKENLVEYLESTQPKVTKENKKMEPILTITKPEPTPVPTPVQLGFQGEETPVTAFEPLVQTQVKVKTKVLPTLEVVEVKPESADVPQQEELSLTEETQDLEKDLTSFLARLKAYNSAKEVTKVKAQADLRALKFYSMELETSIKNSRKNNFK